MRYDNPHFIVKKGKCCSAESQDGDVWIRVGRPAEAVHCLMTRPMNMYMGKQGIHPKNGKLCVKNLG